MEIYFDANSEKMIKKGMYCEDRPVRCNWCGWEGKEKELWYDLIHEEDICPECKKQGCIMDL